MNVKLPLVALLPQKRVLIWAILKDFEFADYCLIIGELERFYGGPQLSRQNQKPHGKNKIPHGKTENLTATNTSQQKPNTSRKKQIPTAKPKLFWFCREVLVLPWQLWATIVRFQIPREFITPFEEISPQQLNKCLQKFYLSARKRYAWRSLVICAPSVNNCRL